MVLSLKTSIAAAAIIGAFPANAAVYLITFSGAINQTQGSLTPANIQIGDSVTSSFLFDTNQTVFSAAIPLGGGISTLYSTSLLNFNMQVGSYSVVSASTPASLYYQDNVFGGDAFGFVVDGLPGGPFGSTFASVQFQARGDNNLLNSSGLANGLPFASAANSFFGSFSNGTDATRVYGNLSVTAALQSALPEPSSWATMLLGFGAIGYAVRRRRTLQQQRS